MLALRRSLLATALLAAPAGAQAPPLTELWRVAGTTLPVPAALADGPSSVFWNPAAPADHAHRRAVGVEILETPDVLALSGLLATAHARLTRRLVIGATLGRMAVTDLVRTTTSPAAAPGDIPVHSQILGVSVGWNGGAVAAGLLVRGHETRLDARRETGVTTDVGIRWHPVAAVTAAAATRFLGPDLRRNASTEFNLGVEGAVPLGVLWGSPARALLGVGTAWHGTEPAEYGGSAALALSDRLTVGWGLAHERAFEATGWRSTLGVAFRTSHYAIMVARGEGLNGLGASYRLGLAAATDQ